MQMIFFYNPLKMVLIQASEEIPKALGTLPYKMFRFACLIKSNITHQVFGAVLKVWGTLF